MDGNLEELKKWADKTLKPAKPKKSRDNPQAREKIFRAARLAKNFGYDVPDDVAEEFYELTAHESGRSHYLNDGKTVKTGVRTPNGDVAIGFSQVMGNTAKPYQSKGLDPYKEDDNLIIGLNEFYNGDKQDPVGRRLAYVGGGGSKALKEYKRTGKVSGAKLYSYLPNNKETYADYVEKSGGFSKVKNWADQTLNGGNTSSNSRNLMSWADGVLSEQNFLPEQEDVRVETDVRMGTDLKTGLPVPIDNAPEIGTLGAVALEDLEAAESPVEKAGIAATLMRDTISGIRQEGAAKLAPPPELLDREITINDEKKTRLTLTDGAKRDKDGFARYSDDFANTYQVSKDGKVKSEIQPNNEFKLTDLTGRTYIKHADQTGLKTNQTRVAASTNATDGIVIAEKTVGKDGKDSYAILGADGKASHVPRRSIFAPTKTANRTSELIAAENQAGGAVDATPEQLAEAQAYVVPEPDDASVSVSPPTQTQKPAPIEAKTDADVLAKGSAGETEVDISKKPKGVNTDDYLVKQGLMSVAPRYGVTEDEVNAFVAGRKDRNAAFSALTDEDIKRLADSDGTYKVKTATANAAINQILQARTGGSADEINPALQTEIGLEQNPLGGLEKNQSNIGIFRAEDEAEAKTRAELANPSTSDIVEKSLQHGLSTVGQTLTSPFYAAYKGIQNSVNEIEDSFKSDDERINSQMEEMRQQYGGNFAEYQKTRDYYNQMSAPETASRMLAETGRGIVKTAVSDVLKGADFLDALNEQHNPFVAVLPDAIKPSLRNAGNYLGYTIAYLQDPKKAANLKFVKSGDDVDKRLFYNIGKRIDEALGEDKYLKDRFLGQISSAAGSGVGFLLLGFVAPEASLAARFSLTSAALGGVTSAGGGYDEAKRQGLTEGEAKLYGAFQGLLGLTEGAGVGASLNRAIQNASLRRVFLSNFVDFAKRNGEKILKGSGEEALQEFVQSTGGKVALEAIKDKDPSSYQRVLNVVNRLPKQAAETLVKDVPVAAITGGVFEGATSIAAGNATNNPRVDFKNNIIEVEGQRFLFTDASKETVQSWVNQQNGLDAVYSEIEDLRTKAKKAKSTEQREIILKQAYLLGNEAATLTARENALMREIEKDLTPIGQPETTVARAAETENIVAPVPETPQTLEAQTSSTKNPESPRIATLFTSGVEVPPLSKDDSQVLFDVSLPNTNETVRLNKEKAQSFFNSNDVPSAEEVRNYISENGYAPLIAKVENVGTDTSDGVAVVARDALGRELSASKVTSEESAAGQAEINKREFGETVSQQIEPIDRVVNNRVLNNSQNISSVPAVNNQDLQNWANKVLEAQNTSAPESQASQLKAQTPEERETARQAEIATAQKEAFALPFISRTASDERFSLTKQIEVTYVTPKGRRMKKTMTVKARQNQLQKKSETLTKLMDCINGSKMLKNCIKKVGKQLNAVERDELEGAFETGVKQGMNEYDASVAALSGYHRSIFDSVNRLRTQVGLKPGEYLAFDASMINAKYAAPTKPDDESADVLAVEKEESGIQTVADVEVLPKAQETEQPAGIQNSAVKNNEIAPETSNAKGATRAKNRVIKITPKNNPLKNPKTAASVLNKIHLIARTGESAQKQADLIKADAAATASNAKTVKIDDYRVEFNEEANEIIRRAVKVYESENPAEADSEPDELIDGLFLEPHQIEGVAEILRNTAGSAVQDAGYSNAEVAPFLDIADALEKAGAARSGAIAYLYNDALPHEESHRASYVGANVKELVNRHKDLWRLTATEAFKKSRQKLADVYHTEDDAILIEETFAWLLGGGRESLGLPRRKPMTS